MNLTKWAILSTALSCLYSCSIDPIEETDYTSPVFIDNLHFAVVKTTNKVTFNYLADPHIAESQSHILYVGVSTGDTNVIYQTNKESFDPIEIFFNHSDTTLTVLKKGSNQDSNDTLFILGLEGTVKRAVPLSLDQSGFKGWYTCYIEYPRISANELKIVNINTKAMRHIDLAENFRVTEGKIAYWTDTSTFLYVNDTISQMPFSVTSLSWINDATISFYRNEGPLISYSISDRVCDTLMNTIGTPREYAISPDSRWLVYTEYDLNAEQSAGFLKSRIIP